MHIIGRWAKSVIPAAIIVLLVWTTALADHASVTFSQTNSNVGGTAIQGVATGGNDGIHAGVGVVGKSTAGKGIGVWGRASHTLGENTGVLGETASTNGRGVFGRATAVSGTTYGVYGESSSTSGRSGGAGYGVYGTVTASSGPSFGVYGRSSSTDGTGVYGAATASSGPTSGVYGQSNSTSGRGVYGTVTTGTGATYGVFGQSSSTSGTGVYGAATASSGTTFGVYGRSDSPSGRGVVGRATASSGQTFGVAGVSESPSGAGIFGQEWNGSLAGLFYGNVTISGNLTVSGTKSFVQPHPTKRNKEIVYIALEGPEAGTYIRGSARLVRGQAIIELPDHFALVTADQGLTVQLTPMGSWLQLYVSQQSPRRIVVREAQGKNGTFHYLVHGIRKGYVHHQVIRARQPVRAVAVTRTR
ncbi:MAG TPA: hypothetical protein VGK88_00750 [bacterium]|jgi:hypothetical protein